MFYEPARAVERKLFLLLSCRFCFFIKLLVVYRVMSDQWHFDL